MLRASYLKLHLNKYIGRSDVTTIFASAANTLQMHQHCRGRIHETPAPPASLATRACMMLLQ
jgi:hypothetical protein